VTYTDPDNDAPGLATVNIDGSGGGYTHDMTYVSGNYNTGAIYKYTTNLAIGSHSFYCLFNDGSKSDQTSVITDPDVVNRAPTVSIDNPDSGDIVSENVLIQVTAYDQDDGGVSKIEYYIDGVLRHTDNSPDLTSPTSTWTWDTKADNCDYDSSHTIRVRAYDSLGDTINHQIVVTVRNNRAPILINAYVDPALGNFNTDFNFYVTYTDLDNDPPGMATINIDGSGGQHSHDMTYVSGNYNTGAVYKYTSKMPIGSHSFYCLFNDGEYQSTTSVIAGPDVMNQPPSVQIIEPLDTSTVTGIVNIQVQASDLEDMGVTRVDYLVDGFSKYTDDSPSLFTPASVYDLDTTQYSDGVHTITVKAYDSEGAFSSHEISVMVNNTILSIMTVGFVDDFGNPLTNEFYKHYAYSYHLEVKTTKPATIEWNGKQFEYKGPGNVYALYFDPEDFTWGEWNETGGGIINNISVLADNDGETDSKSISVNCRETSSGRASYHIAHITETIYQINKLNTVNLAQAIRDKKSLLVDTEKFQDIASYTVDGKTITAKMKVSTYKGDYYWELFFQESGEHKHYSIIDGKKVHVHGDLPGGERFLRPSEGNYLVDDLVKVEMDKTGRIYRATYIKDAEKYIADIPDFDPRFVHTRPQPASFSTLDEAVVDAAHYFDTYQSWHVPKQGIGTTLKVGINNRLRTVSKWGKYVRWGGWILEGGFYVWDVNEILSASSGDKIEKLTIKTGETIGGIGGGMAGVWAGAYVGAFCGPGAVVCVPAGMLIGGIGGAIGGSWGGEIATKTVYKIVVEGQEIDFGMFTDETYDYLTNYCEQLHETPEDDYRCLNEYGESVIAIRHGSS